MELSAKGKLTILFDTNLLMTAAHLHLDLFDLVEKTLGTAYEPGVLAANIKELTAIAKWGRPRNRREARVALELAEACKLVDVEDTDLEADEAILHYAIGADNIIIATNDADLRRRLRKANRAVLFMRKNGRIEVMGSETY